MPTAQADLKVLTQEPGNALTFYRSQQAVINQQIALLTQNSEEERRSNPDSPATQGVLAAISALQEKQTSVSSLISVSEQRYAQMTLPSVPSHATGHVEDPRLVKRALLPFWGGISLTTVVLFMALGTTILEAGWAMIAMFLSIVVETLPFLILGRCNDSRLFAAGIPLYGTQLFYRGTLPAHAWQSYQTAEASGLFEKIRIWAPRQAFHKVTFGDPIIFGEVEGQQFLIVQFNLSLDLQGV